MAKKAENPGFYRFALVIGRKLCYPNACIGNAVKKFRKANGSAQREAAAAESGLAAPAFRVSLWSGAAQRERAFFLSRRRRQAPLSAAGVFALWQKAGWYRGGKSRLRPFGGAGRFYFAVLQDEDYTGGRSG
ncbi:hypothetical protein DRA42_10125 [Ethanoligenens harbinense]|nr:hypothetical protein CXQ68_10095 [Ethanoligenens harbinense YUAN-3]AYF39206.1 hypothetical protein CXP51_09985 [Ethanoligenens harbinense]AYF42029.1 hypothetical protein CN246_10535 [Ethanoligenens harbinense]QCN92784.1 hypothetical protein DRA42_10125 [Ethanoligenens harbinense]